MTIYKLEELDPAMQYEVKRWLEINSADVTKLRHGVFPLGYVQSWIDRARRAEEELSSRSDLSDD